MVKRLNILDTEKVRLEDALHMEQNIQKFHIRESDILKYLDSMGGDPRNPETRHQLLDEDESDEDDDPDDLMMTHPLAEAHPGAGRKDLSGITALLIKIPVTSYRDSGD